jgi:ElaB/YqjD/DUF883 family membrane-anchored ribosome-binding protein
MSARNLEELADEARELVADAQNLATRSATRASREALTAFQDRVEQVQAKFAQLGKTAQKKVIDAAHRSDEVVRKNPYQFIAIAAGIGALMGVLAVRRRR